MGKLIMWNLMTVDGMFEGPQPWDLDFHEYAWGDELKRFSLEQAQEVEALLFGRRTYEGMAAHWQTASGETADFMNAVPKPDSEPLKLQLLQSRPLGDRCLLLRCQPAAVAVAASMNNSVEN